MFAVADVDTEVEMLVELDGMPNWKGFAKEACPSPIFLFNLPDCKNWGGGNGEECSVGVS